MLFIVTTPVITVVVIFIIALWPRMAPGKFSVLNLSSCHSVGSILADLEAAGCGEVGD